MRALVTGVSGFVGRHLAEHLLAKGREVLGVDLTENPDAPYRSQTLDILDFDALLALVEEFKPDEVYHLAGRVKPRESVEDPHPYFEVNVGGTLNLLEAVRRVSHRARVLVVSSSHVYGSDVKARNLVETDRKKPESPYAASKLLAESLALHYWNFCGLETVIARPFNHTGPGQLEGFVVPDLCRRVIGLRGESLKGKQTLSVRDLDVVRDFLDVRDVVRAYRMLLESGSSGGVYNVCSGEGVSVREFLQLIIESAALGFAPRIRNPQSGSHKDDRLVGDNELLCSATGWKRTIPLERTIRDVLEGFQ